MANRNLETLSMGYVTTVPPHIDNKEAACDSADDSAPHWQNKEKEKIQQLNRLFSCQNNFAGHAGGRFGVVKDHIYCQFRS